MTIARLTATVEALSGTPSNAQQIARIGNALYALTDSPQPDATNAQKAVAVMILLRQHIRALLRAGAGANAFNAQMQANIAQIKAAELAAEGDL